MEKLANLSKSTLELLRTRYDVYGTEDGVYYDTWNGNTKRTLMRLERLGFIKTWVDVEDPARMWAAALPKRVAPHA